MSARPAPTFKILLRIEIRRRRSVNAKLCHLQLR
jgi:hypothetical protein